MTCRGENAMLSSARPKKSRASSSHKELREQLEEANNTYQALFESLGKSIGEAYGDVNNTKVFDSPGTLRYWEMTFKSILSIVS